MVVGGIRQAAGTCVLVTLLLWISGLHAYGDDLSALKRQLSELHLRLDRLSVDTPHQPGPTRHHRAIPGIFRGSEPDPHAVVVSDEAIPHDRGFTILFSPAADVPIPTHTVTISGYVKGNVVFDVDDQLGDQFNVGAITAGAPDNGPHFRIYARHSRIRVRSKSDTSVGPVRTYIEGDFFGNTGNQVISNSDGLRIRHAWADWDATDSLNIGVGQTWSNFMSNFALPPSIDPRGPAGRSFMRQGQVRLTYKHGNALLALAVENPETDIQAAVAAGGPAGVTCSESTGTNSCGAVDRVPDFTARLHFKTQDNHQFQISGVVRELRTETEAAAPGFAGTDSEIGWGLLAAASFDLSPFTARIQATYGDGIGRYGSQYHGTRAAIARNPAAIDLETVEAFSLLASLTFDVTDTSKFTAAYGRVDFARGDTLVGQNQSLQNIYVNWIYRPVSAVQLGFEVNWAERHIRGGGTDDALRLGFATWFYF